MCRKYFDPQEDGFFNNYGFDKGQYHGERSQKGNKNMLQ